MREKRISFRNRNLWPIAIWFIVNALVYGGARVLTRGRVFFDMTTPLDSCIPLWTPAVIVYIASYAFWVIGFYDISRGETQHYFYVMSAELAAKFICFVIYLLLPTQKSLPEFEAHSLCGWLLKLVYELDEPNVLFPSIHCLDSYFIFRGCFGQKHLKKSIWVFNFFMAMAVFVSTLLTHQHVVVDLFAAVIVAELGFWIAKKWNLGSKYQALILKM